MIRISITIKFCIKHTSHKFAVAFRNPGTDGNPNAINVSRRHHIRAYFTKYRPSPYHSTVTLRSGRCSANRKGVYTWSLVGIATGYGLDGPGIESRWEARFSAPVQTGSGAHPASTGSFPGVKSGQGITLTTHPLLVPWS
jgi:hypothetical protein